MNEMDVEYRMLAWLSAGKPPPTPFFRELLALRHLAHIDPELYNLMFPTPFQIVERYFM